MANSLNSLVPELRAAAQDLVTVCAQAGLYPRVTSTLRSFQDQKVLYDKYKSGKWPYPVAAPGTSAHEWGGAFDMVVEPYEALPEVGRVWTSWGGQYGGAYNDPVHFGLPGVAADYGVEIKTAPESSTMAEVLDLILSFNPVIGTVELVAWLVSFGFPKSEVLKFLSGPVEYVW